MYENVTAMSHIHTPTILLYFAGPKNLEKNPMTLLYVSSVETKNINFYWDLQKR